MPRHEQTTSQKRLENERAQSCPPTCLETHGISPTQLFEYTDSIKADYFALEQFLDQSGIETIDLPIESHPINLNTQVGQMQYQNILQKVSTDAQYNQYGIGTNHPIQVVDPLKITISKISRGGSTTRGVNSLNRMVNIMVEQLSF